MYVTGKEIFGQYAALRQTYHYFLENGPRITAFFAKHKPKSLTFIGSGSGYTLCHSGEVSTKQRLDLGANSVAAGDLLLNFNHYERMLQGSVLIASSRSGGTSEVVLSAKKALEAGVPTLAVSAKENSALSKVAQLNLEIPWAFDESVCQTRTVTNFYTTNLLLIALLADDQNLLAEIDEAIAHGEQFMAEYKELTKEVALAKWEKTIILADSELEGIAAEAALAFAEIPQIPGNYYHVLDVRHGPMVLVDEKTLVIMALSPAETELQKDLISDLKARKALVATISMDGQKDLGATWEVKVPFYENFAVLGIPFIFIPQAIAFYKALARGLNPDKPGGLDAWIELNN